MNPKTYLNSYKYRYIGTSLMGVILVGVFGKRLREISINANNSPVPL